MKLEEIANYVQDKLLKQGFIIHRYEAFSTNSIYLKLDYGVMNSIRISDHSGKKHLSYKYNIIKGSTSSYWDKDYKGYWKYFCQPNKTAIDNMIEIILENKLKKKTMYNYNELMEKYKKESEYSKGFWQQSWEVKL